MAFLEVMVISKIKKSKQNKLFCNKNTFQHDLVNNLIREIKKKQGIIQR